MDPNLAPFRVPRCPKTEVRKWPKSLIFTLFGSDPGPRTRTKSGPKVVQKWTILDPYLIGIEALLIGFEAY